MIWIENEILLVNREKVEELIARSKCLQNIPDQEEDGLRMQYTLEELGLWHD